MSAKPSIALARWADQIGANLVSPTSDERDLGFGNATTASSGKVNTELNQLYQWALYLSDGALVGDHTIDGALTVGGAALTFASTAFTASSSTDALTITAHGLQTGYGPLRVTNSGGALPAPLLAATDYWAIRVDADSFKLATSFLNAMAGIAIDLTTNGTGTNTIASASGTRPTKVTVSGDLSAGRVLPLVNAGWPLSAAAWIQEDGSGVYGGSFPGQWTVAAGASARFVAPLVLPVGTVLTRLRFSYSLGAVGNHITVALGSLIVATGANVEANLATDTTSTTWTTLDATNVGVDSNGDFNASAGPYVTRADRLYWIALNLTARVSGTFQFAGAILNP